MCAGAGTGARSVPWPFGWAAAGRCGGMVAVRTVAPGARSRACAAWPAECVSTVSARLSRALVSATSPGRRSCGSTLWQMTAVRGCAAPGRP